MSADIHPLDCCLNDSRRRLGEFIWTGMPTRTQKVSFPLSACGRWMVKATGTRSNPKFFCRTSGGNMWVLNTLSLNGSGTNRQRLCCVGGCVSWFVQTVCRNGASFKILVCGLQRRWDCHPPTWIQNTKHLTDTIDNVKTELQDKESVRSSMESSSKMGGRCRTTTSKRRACWSWSCGCVQILVKTLTR